MSQHPSAAVKGQMECNGPRAGDEPEREGELVLEPDISPVEARKEQLAEGFEVSRREYRFSVHGAMLPEIHMKFKCFP